MISSYAIISAHNIINEFTDHHHDAKDQLGTHVLIGMFNSALSFVDKAAQHGNVEAQLQLGKLYHVGADRLGCDSRVASSLT